MPACALSPHACPACRTACWHKQASSYRLLMQTLRPSFSDIAARRSMPRSLFRAVGWRLLRARRERVAPARRKNSSPPAGAAACRSPQALNAQAQLRAKRATLAGGPRSDHMPFWPRTCSSGRTPWARLRRWRQLPQPTRCSAAHGSKRSARLRTYVYTLNRTPPAATLPATATCLEAFFGFICLHTLQSCRRFCCALLPPKCPYPPARAMPHGLSSISFWICLTPSAPRTTLPFLCHAAQKTLPCLPTPTFLHYYLTRAHLYYTTRTCPLWNI